MWLDNSIDWIWLPVEDIMLQTRTARNRPRWRLSDPFMHSNDGIGQGVGIDDEDDILHCHVIHCNVINSYVINGRQSLPE